MSIHYLSYKDIDLDKYNACISNALNSRIYAFSWYLDRVTDRWSVLVLNDYEAVMPLPERKKMGVNYIYQAPWVQQLGVFSRSDLHEKQLIQFIDAIPKKFKLVDILFHSKNNFKSVHLSQRDNYLLDLNRSYQNIYKGFSKGRKSSVKLAQKNNLDIKINFDYGAVIRLFLENKGLSIQRLTDDYLKLAELMETLIQRRQALVYQVFDQDGMLIGGAFILIEPHRLTYIFSAINEAGRKKQAMSYLLAHIFEENSNKKLIFDFEGSMIPEIGHFFKSFGASKETYYHFKQRRFF